MIKIQDWIAIIPPDEKHIAYVGEGQAEQRDFFLTGSDWQRYKEWGFHLDMAFDLTTVTTHDQRQTVKTQVSSSENVGETLVTSTATTTKESYTATDEQVEWDYPTDIAYLAKTVEEDGIRLTWTVLRQHTQLPGKLYATLRAMEPAGAIKKSALMVFEVEPAIIASQAADVPVSEFEEMEAHMDATLEAVQQNAQVAAANAKAAATAAQEAYGHCEDAEAYKTAAETMARTVAEQVDYVDDLAMTVADSTALSESNAASARQSMLLAIQQSEIATTAAESATVAAEEAEAAATRAEDAAARVAPPDDIAVSGKTTWSSKNTVDRLCEAFTVSGDAVQCYPVENYPLTVEARGKNLMPPGATTTVNGVTFTYSHDGTVTISGTATANAYMVIPFAAHLPSGTYTLSLNNAEALETSNVYLMLRDDAGSYGTAIIYANTVNAVKTFATVGEKIDATLMVRQGTTLNGFTMKPQLESGDTATAYEPYRESVTVWHGGKNLIPDSLTTTVNGITFTAGDDGAITISGTATAHASIKIPFQPHLPSGTYTLSLNNAKALGNNNVYIMLRDYAGSYGSTIVYANMINAFKTFTNSDAKVDAMLMVLNGTTLDGFTVKPQLEVGSVATAYERHREETITFSTAAPAIIPALPGCNTLYADSGKVTVTGREDPRHTVGSLKERIAALEAAIVNNG